MGQRAKGLLVPYLVFGLLGYLFYMAGYFVAQMAGLTIEQFNYGLWRPLWGVFYGTVGDGLLVNSPLWFLPALWLCSGALVALNRSIHRVWIRYAITIVAFALGVWLAERIKLPLSLSSALCAAVFMQWGMDSKKHISPAVPTRHLLAALLIFGALSLFAPINGGVGLAGPSVNHPLLFMFFACVGTVFSVALSILIHNKVPLLTSTFITLGQNSLAILVLHMLAIKGVKVLLGLVLGIGIADIEDHLGWGLLVLALSGICLWPAIVTLKRWAPWTMGQPNSKHAGVST
jgi:acyltransferase